MVGSAVTSGSQHALSNSREGILILEGKNEDDVAPGYDATLNNAISNLAVAIDTREQCTSGILKEELSISLDVSALPNTLQQPLRATEPERLAADHTSSLLEVRSGDLEDVSDLVLSLERAMPAAASGHSAVNIQTEQAIQEEERKPDSNKYKAGALGVGIGAALLGSYFTTPVQDQPTSTPQGDACIFPAQDLLLPMQSMTCESNNDTLSLPLPFSPFSGLSRLGHGSSAVSLYNAGPVGVSCCLLAGYCVRKLYSDNRIRGQIRKEVAAATKIQTVARKHSAENQLAALKQAAQAEKSAATKIQVVARKHSAENQLIALRQAAQEEKSAATKIQTVARKHSAENQLVALKKAAEAAAKHRAEEQLVALQREAEAAQRRAEEQLVAVQREAEARRRAEEQLVALQREAAAAQRRAEEQLVAVQREAAAAQRRVEEQLAAAQRRAEEYTIGAFGAMEWKQYFGDVGPAPALPSDIGTILGSTCPIWPERKVRDTHLLVLMPATVDGAPFTLNLLGELIQRPKNGGHETKYRYYGSDTQAQFGAASPECSYWLLMTRDVLEGSRSKSYSAQKALVESHASRTGHPYAVPRALEAATAILMHHTRTKERLFGDDPRTYARCQELADGNPVVVGGFDSSGLFVVYDDDVFSNSGVSGCRKF